MRHYEIVFLVHPERSDEVQAMVDRYRDMVADAGGHIHRYEDWGRRALAYPIHGVNKAHYVLLNIECDGEVRQKIESAFKFNDAVLRSLIIRTKTASTEPSPVMLEKQREAEKEAERVAREKARQAKQEQQRREAQLAPVDAVTAPPQTTDNDSASGETESAERTPDAESESLAGDHAQVVASDGAEPDASPDVAAPDAKPDTTSTAATPDVETDAPPTVHSSEAKPNATSDDADSPNESPSPPSRHN